MKELILKQMTGTPLDNLNSIYKSHGKTFYIKYNNKRIEFELIKKLLHNKYDYFIIQTKQEVTLPSGLYAIRIVSFESDNGIDTFTAHLDNISVNKKINVNSGTEAIEIATKIIKMLNFKRAQLLDVAKVKCELDVSPIELSLYKFFERNSYFYQKYGFEPEFNKDMVYIRNLFERETFQQEFSKMEKMIREYPINKLISKLKKIKGDLISMIKNNDYHKYIFYILHGPDDYGIFKEIKVNEQNNISFAFDQLEKITNILIILESIRGKKKLYQLLLALDCYSYNQLVNYLFGETYNKLFTIRKGKEKNSIDFIKDFFLFNLIRNNLKHVKKIE
jgi:hypothetical protein